MASSTVQSVAPQPPNPNSNPNPSTHKPSSRKRPLDHALSSPYFKMRLIHKDLRTLFLQVNCAPEFRHSEAARGILEKMKLMVDICKQMAKEAPPIMKCNNGSERQAFASKKPNWHGEKPVEPRAVEGEEFVKLGEEEDVATLGTRVVGGSAFGWNFVTFVSRKPKYYGRSKESFRAANPKLETGEPLNP